MKLIANRLKRLMAVLVYLLLICCVLDFQIVRLFDLKQILLVAAGGLCLYLPGIDWSSWRRKYRESPTRFTGHRKEPKETQGKNPKENLKEIPKEGSNEISREIREEQKWFEAQRFARCVLTASTLQTFIVFFILLSNLTDTKDLVLHMALACKPAFYGICIWSIFGEKEERGARIPQEEPGTLTVEMCYNRYLELGLSKREAEVALQVEKGLSNGEIAAELHISETTVKKHISNIFEKLDISKREEIVKKRNKK